MLKEAIEKILSLAPASVLTLGTREYTDRSIYPQPEPQLAHIGVCTLNGFVDLISNNLEFMHADSMKTSLFVHVVTEAEVQLIAKESDKWGRRLLFAKAKLMETVGFRFGEFMWHEPFVIGLQANFTDGGDRDYVLKLASNISSERVGTSADDGISQQVGVRSGVALKTQETIRARVQLAPYRTFREIEQPLSEFVLRVQQGAEGVAPKLALFEADGGSWKLTAIEAIARYLRPKVKDIPVVS